MAVLRNFSVPYDKDIEKYLRRGTYLGVGHNGIVYSLKNNRIIKIFNDESLCKKEYYILKKTQGSKYFPKVYKAGNHYIVREMVHGKRLDKYLKDNKLSIEIADALLELLWEFKRLRFTRLDIRCKDIYVCENNELRIIDPKNNYSKYVDYPRHLMKGLNSSDNLDIFFERAEKRNKYVYRMWREKFDRYLREGIK